MTEIQRGFRDVDSQAAPPQFSAYLSTLSMTLAQEKAKTLKQLRPTPGARLLDVGCGQGIDATHLAGAVAPDGHVVGLDLSQSLIREARRANRWHPTLRFTVADAHELPFPDSTFDGARTERVLQHVEEPSKVLAEMCRVVRPGGRIVASEPDWESLVIDSSDPAATRRICHAICDDRIRNPRIGRQLVGRLAKLNTEIVEVVPTTMVLRALDLATEVLSLQDVAPAPLLAELRERDSLGQSFAAITGFTVVALA